MVKQVAKTNDKKDKIVKNDKPAGAKAMAGEEGGRK